MECTNMLTTEHYKALIAGLNIYLSVASEVESDSHIKLIEEALREFEQHVVDEPKIEDLFDDSI
jgi:hypothetical protein